MDSMFLDDDSFAPNNEKPFDVKPSEENKIISEETITFDINRNI